MKKFSKNSLLASTVIASMAFTAPAFAQDQDMDDASGPVEGTDPEVGALGQETQGDIIVTGTRIARPNVESASPVTVVSNEAIAAVGTTRLEDLVNSLPQVTPGQTAFVSNGATGTATVNLRGLGTARTLVLVNGRRLQPGDPFLPVADLNQIPAALVERVEVLTGGASSTYGADAVAGVVNFIMDTDFEGVQLDVTYGVYQHNNDNDTVLDPDGPRPTIRDMLDARGFDIPDGNVVDGATFDAQLSIGAGFDDGRGNVVAYVGYRDIEPILQGARDHSACATQRLSSGAWRCGGSSNAINTTISDPAFDLFGSLVGDGSDDFSGAFVPYNYAPVNFFQRDNTRWTAGAFANYEISENVEAYAEFMFMDDRSNGRIAESGTFFFEPYPIVCGDNPATPEVETRSALLNDAQAATLCGLIDGNADRGDPDADGVVPLYFGKRNVEGGERNADLRHTGYRAVGGVRGDITDRFSYDVSAQFGTTIYKNAYTNDFSASRLRQAVQAIEVDGQVVCADPTARANGCVPYNPFQGSGLVNDPRNGITQGALNYVSIPGVQTGETEEFVVTGYLTGELFNISPIEPVTAVIGAEHRTELLNLDSDVVFETGDLTGQGGASPSVEGSFEVQDIFAELLLPIIVDGVVDRFSIEAGYRFSSYSTGAETDTYKIAAELAPVPELKIRGGYNRAVRAANILELFTPQSLGLWSGTDPCGGATPEFTLAQCQNTGVTAAQYGSIALSPADQYNAIYGGNPNVDPETADTYTVGVVLQGGDFVPGFVATVDYFQIDVEGAITNIAPETILRQCATTANPDFCSLVTRSPASGSLWAGQQGFIVATQQNIGGLGTEGVDIGLSYNRSVGPGRMNLDLTGTYLLESYTDVGVAAEGGDGITDCVGYHGSFCGFPTPEWRHTLRAAYNFDSGVGLSFRWRYIGEVENDTFIDDPDRQFSGDGVSDVNIDAYSFFDASVNFDVTDEFGFRVGVNNILDTDPPIITSAFGTDNANTWAGTYDPVGRYIFINASLSF
ncbi:TonB-dependent receptor domain-containing protein [Sphingomicrobium marinum]|uniref:TonB-dependent receptor domain-containing protein n=1 Tax=Sphingomicrobium marinum TaxID=1227950 RepID=UPI00223EA838|nr:TonB-dependent receptor [Sphingomicrobium marinum]